LNQHAKFTPSILREIVARGEFTIYCDDQQLAAGRMRHLQLLGDVTVAVLKTI